MPMKISLAALFLALLPGVSLAQGCMYEKDVTASACGEGQTYDATVRACVPATTS
ncbi:hypothetical protein GEU84_000900 [Fertoebacter nigrum]|uniref:Adenylosuccinate lyase n=1 Tax=Fertoeibacter niger TaxID=2656921 RepID=A0A8X8KMG1_9RHOB|nr:hypothetical protein [Fertoeibacter niger]NUB42930.1 hypothetical protein [Fertoeibacter niger]